MGREPYLENRLTTLINSVNQSQISENEILNTLQSNTNISELDIEMYINSIDKYSAERETQMNEINEVTITLENNAEYNAEEYEQQIKLLLMTEQRLRDIKLKLEVLRTNKLNKAKQVSISTYYQKYYRAWSGFMGIFFLLLVINIIFIYLVYKEYLPSIVVPFIVAISIVALILLSSDLRKRSKIIFDEYDWYFDPNNVNLTTFTSSEPEAATEEEATARTCASTIAASIEESGGTIQCEEGKIYDTSLYKCVIKPEENNDENTQNNVEAFSNHLECKSINIE